jgi:hypothetical protein
MAELQIINQSTKDLLKIRTQRDKLTKNLFELRQSLYRLNILIEADHIRIADIKVRMHKDTADVFELHKKRRSNQINIELEHKKMTAFKMEIIDKLIDLDNQNLSGNFDFRRELEINKLSNNMNYDAPSDWEINKEKYSSLRDKYDKEIEIAEAKVKSYEVDGLKYTNNIIKMLQQKNIIENDIEKLTEDILALNDQIPDKNESHPITIVKVADAHETLFKSG